MTLKNGIVIFVMLWGCVGFGLPALYGFETASPITDREIIESLTQLKEGQKQIHQRIDQLQKEMDQRFDQINQRFTFLENLVMILIASILGLIGFVVWDRKTALRPLEKKLDRLEQDLQHDLELQRPDGSRLTRLIHALGELAKYDPKVAETLKAFSLL